MKLGRKTLVFLTSLAALLSMFLISSVAMGDWYPASGQGGP